MHCK